MPTTVTSTGSGVRMVVASPTSRSPPSAEALSMTTSPGPSGVWPSAIRQGLISGSAIQFPAWVGGRCPRADRRRIRRSDRSRRSRVRPWRRRRPRRRRRRRRHRADRVRGCRRSRTSVLLRTIASVPALASPNMSPKPVSIVSPSTRVPDRNATPSTTAELVASRRRLWAPMLLIVVLHMTISSRTPSGARARARRWGPASGRRRGRRPGTRRRRRRPPPSDRG